MLYSIWLLVAMGVAFVLQFALGALGIPFTQFLWFTPALALQQPWTWVTSLFLHASLTHVFFNGFALFMFGPFLETKIGGNRFLALYFGAGLVANLAYLLTAADPLVPGLGASGAIFGILGALAVLEPHVTIFLGFVPMPMWVAAIVWVVLETVSSFTPSAIANTAHLGGLFAGFAYGFYLRKRAGDVLEGTDG